MGIISLSFDDNRMTHFENVIPLLEKYSFPGTFCLIARQASINYLKRMQTISEKHEIVDHSRRHIKLSWYKGDLSLFEDDLVFSKKYLEENTKHSITGFAYPGGYYSPEFASIINKYYRYALRVKNKYNSINKFLYINRKYLLNRYIIGNQTTNKRIAKLVNAVKTKKRCWLIFVLHSITKKKFTFLLTTIKQNNVPMYTCNDSLNYINKRWKYKG